MGRVQVGIPGKSNEWFTPLQYAQAAHRVMDGIELDPASCPEANETIGAARIYTKEDDGLLQPWRAKSVWCNPPYGRTKGIRSFQTLFIEKLLRSYQAGDVAQAILLCTADIDEKWFQPLLQFLICCPDHKVWFHRPGLPDEKHIMGSCFVYLGPHKQRFIDEFSEFGTIIQRIASPKHSSRVELPWEILGALLSQGTCSSG